MLELKARATKPGPDFFLLLVEEGPVASVVIDFEFVFVCLVFLK